MDVNAGQPTDLIILDRRGTHLKLTAALSRRNVDAGIREARERAMSVPAMSIVPEIWNRSFVQVSVRFLGANLAITARRMASANCFVPSRPIIRARWTSTVRTLMLRSKAFI
jgi:hypothetical protein